MTIIQSVILGVVQGITEFFPISSSGHLIAIRYLFDFKDSLSSKEWLVFDVALHFGTMLAIAIFFFKDFLKMFTQGFNFKNKEGKLSFNNLSSHGKILWYIIAACIPGALAGVLFDDYISGVIRENPVVIATTLIVMGTLLYIADKKAPATEEIEKMTFKKAFFIGVGQMFAIIPGFSRSGTTMTVARILKFKREDSAKFSFLLGAPVMLGATIYSMKDLTPSMLNIQFLIGVFVSFAVGMLAIKTLMYIVKKIGFGVFAIYRFALAIIIIAKIIIR